jgi:hypothetical protein
MRQSSLLLTTLLSSDH